MKPKSEQAREERNQQKVLEFVKRRAKGGEYGERLLVLPFKYFYENINLEKRGDLNAQAIQDALADLDRAGKIQLLSFIDGNGEYENVVIRLPRQHP